MTSDPKLPQCAAVDGCDSYGHPLRCESVATSQQTGLCDRHTTCERSPLAEEINELPERLRSWIHHLETDADPAGTLRENFVLREAAAALGAKVEKAEARLDRLADIARRMVRPPDTSDLACHLERVAELRQALADIEKEPR